MLYNNNRFCYNNTFIVTNYQTKDGRIRRI